MSVLFYNKSRIKTNVLTNMVIKEADEKDVNFYDYDGFRLLSYTNSEALTLTSLPKNPVANKNLTFDGWNWSLANIKSHINNVGGVVNVGAVYYTTDDKTHIIFKPTEYKKTASICLTPTDANDVIVDWGDGTTSTWTGTSEETKTHTYTNVNDKSVYDIAISCTTGTYSFPTYITESQGTNETSCYIGVNLSRKVTELELCFSECRSIKFISVPNNISISYNSFYGCRSLEHLTLPNSATEIPSNCFYFDHSLKTVSVPDNVESFGAGCFSSCYSLQSITIPSSVESFGQSCFSLCYSLQSITIPNNVTNFGNQCFNECNSLQYINLPNNANFTSLGNYCFTNCYSLPSLTIPSSVTSIGSSCITGYCLSKLYVKPTTPPTLSSTGSISGSSNLVIYVPTGTLSTYQNANVWSNFSSKMKEYNF